MFKNLLEKNLSYLLVLGLLVAVFYFPLVASINNLTFGNDIASNWIYAFYLKKSFWEYGQLPLWNEQFLSGFPMDTSNLAGIFYPPHWIFIFLPLKLSFNLLTLIHVYLIGVFSFMFATSEFKLSKKAAFFAATSIMLSPKIFNHNYLGHLNLVESIPWLILGIMFYWKAIERKKLKLVLLSGFSLSLIILVFSVFYIYALFFLGVITLVRMCVYTLQKKNLRDTFRPLFYAVVCIIYSGLVSAVFLLPFLQFSTLSLRSRLDFWEGAFPSIYLDNLPQLFYIFPHRFHDSETLIYVGVPTLLLGLFGALKFLRKKEVVVLILLSLFALTVAFGANQVFYKIYYRFIPVFHYMRAPLRIWILFIIGLGLLSGFGVDSLLVRFKKYSVWLYSAIFVLTLISFGIYSKDYFKLVDYENEKQELLNVIPNDGARVYCLDNCLFTPKAIEKGYKFASGGEVVLLKSYYDYMNKAGGYKFNGYSLSVPPYQIGDKKSVYYETQSPNPKLLGKLNVGYIVSPYEIDSSDLVKVGEAKGYVVYRNKLALPQVYLDPSTEKGSVRLVKDTPKEIVVEASVEKYSKLVLSDVYYPGWVAFDNGNPLEIESRDGVVRAVSVGFGKHEVVFRYQPTLLIVGSLISIVSIIGLVWVLRSRKLD